MAIAVLVVLPASSGCHHSVPTQPRDLSPPPPCTAIAAPRELNKAILPEYRIEPPDVLSIVGTHIVPLASYRLRTMDEVSIHVMGTLPDNPISGLFPIVPGGTVDLGSGYGMVTVAGKTVDETRMAIEQQLVQFLREPRVTVTLARTGSAEQIAGEHLVAPDGRITLGTYGDVLLVGLTKNEAKQAIEGHLAQFFEEPEVAVDVLGYNSKVYYVITQGAGLGDNVYSFPSTGNETVLDAIVQINGLNASSSKQIWIARPGRNRADCDQILPIDWQAVTTRGDVATNYQVLPGDRVYVAQDKWVAFDTYLAKVMSPFERLMGFTLLGAETATRLSGRVLRGGGNPNRLRGGL